MKSTVFKYIQPATLAAILLFWGLSPKWITDNDWTVIIAGPVTLIFVLLLERINERHASWRMNKTEFATDLFYVVLGSTVLLWIGNKVAEDPLKAVKHSLGITTEWAMHMPMLAQVALIVFLIEFGQYWMHRLMHNSPLWWTHAPHHHITQLNAAKGAVGNPVELVLVGLSVVSLFDFDKVAIFAAANVLVAVPAFAHANVRFDPPRWYSFFFTTIEHHSLHHSLAYEDTRCNYANSLVLCDRMCGTFRDGEAEVVGQDERRRLSIPEQFIFPARPLIDRIKTRRSASEPRAEVA